jgi:hypothetical protein
MEKEKYVFPNGEFFYTNRRFELICQKMVIRGMNYLDDNPEMKDLVMNCKKDVSGDFTKQKELVKLCDFIKRGLEASNNMVKIATINIVRALYSDGWDKYIEKIKK